MALSARALRGIPLTIYVCLKLTNATHRRVILEPNAPTWLEIIGATVPPERTTKTVRHFARLGSRAILAVLVRVSTEAPAFVAFKTLPRTRVTVAPGEQSTEVTTAS